MIVTDKENLPKTMFLTTKKLVDFVSTQFLVNITKIGLGNGVQRDGYFVLNMDGIFRLPPDPSAKETRDFVKFIEAVQQRGYNYLFIKL